MCWSKVLPTPYLVKYDAVVRFIVSESKAFRSDESAFESSMIPGTIENDSECSAAKLSTIAFILVILSAKGVIGVGTLVSATLSLKLGSGHMELLD